MKNPFKLPLDTHRHAAFSTPLRLLLATTAALWMGASQAQPMAPTITRQPSELRFRDFFSTPIGPAGLEITDKLRLADGQTVRLVGYMVQQENAVPGQFLLAPRPVQMSEHADGEADDLPPSTVLVKLDPTQQDWVVPHVRGLVAVNGQLSVARHEGTDGRVSWVRLQLEPEAAHSMNAVELTGYLHKQTHQH